MNITSTDRSGWPYLVASEPDVASVDNVDWVTAISSKDVQDSSSCGDSYGLNVLESCTRGVRVFTDMCGVPLTEGSKVFVILYEKDKNHKCYSAKVTSVESDTYAKVGFTSGSCIKVSTTRILAGIADSVIVIGKPTVGSYVIARHKEGKKALVEVVDVNSTLSVMSVVPLFDQSLSGWEMMIQDEIIVSSYVNCLFKDYPELFL